MASQSTRTMNLAGIVAIAGTIVMSMPGGAAEHAGQAAPLPFKAAKMIIEYNASAEDVGVQFFLDSNGWQSIKVFDPRGRLIYDGSATGSLLEQGGGTELFLESVEPALDDLPLEEFEARFPEGQYRFLGRTKEGRKMVSRVPFSHDIPAGPEVITPAQPGPDDCAQGVGNPVVVSWHPVDKDLDGDPIEIVAYEVIVEHEDQVFDIRLPGDATEVTVPAQFIQAGTDYIFEVLAIEEGGNQTITEGCFATP